MTYFGQSFQCHVSPADGPFAVLLGKDGADETDDGFVVGEGHEGGSNGGGRGLEAAGPVEPPLDLAALWNEHRHR